MTKIKIQDINIGDVAEIEKKMTFDMVKAFADISEDHNPVHLNKSYAEESRYKKQIIHGLMATSLFSGLFGMKLPGEGCVYKSQNIKFKRPIFIGDIVRARIEVIEISIKLKTIKFTTLCFANERIAIDGDAEIFIP